MRVEEVDLDATYDLRRRVLLDETRDVVLAGDELAGTFHLAVVDDDGALVAVATFLPTGSGEVQLRGMAVDPGRQSAGLGRVLLDAAVARLRADGVTRLWANARDTAVPFYERLGWRVTGDGFLHAESGLPHHSMELEL
jgi:GNAT superfamily N-acetyltransferase